MYPLASLCGSGLLPGTEEVAEADGASPVKHHAGGGVTGGAPNAAAARRTSKRLSMVGGGGAPAGPALTAAALAAAATTAAPDAESAAAIALPDEEIGNRLYAFATLSADADVDAILAHCRTRLPKYMVPETLVVRDELPRTSTNKIDRKVLRTELLEVASS